MSSWHGGVVIPALLAFCDDNLWLPASREEMHRRCHGYSLITFHAPSGSGPWTYGLCTCPCHAKQKEQEAKDNRERWEYLIANRAPLDHSPDRWMQTK